MKLQELDDWYKENEAALDDLRAVRWDKLAHADKLKIYQDVIKSIEQERLLSANAAARFHAEHKSRYGIPALTVWQAQYELGYTPK